MVPSPPEVFLDPGRGERRLRVRPPQRERWNPQRHLLPSQREENARQHLDPP